MRPTLSTLALFVLLAVSPLLSACADMQQDAPAQTSAGGCPECLNGPVKHW